MEKGRKNGLIESSFDTSLDQNMWLYQISQKYPENYD